jgi:hypothetical protein
MVWIWEGPDRLRLLYSVPGRRPGNPRYSRDGCHVAFQEPTETSGPSLRIYNLETNHSWIAVGASVGPGVWLAGNDTVAFSGTDFEGFQLFLKPLRDTGLVQISAFHGQGVAIGFDVMPDDRYLVVALGLGEGLYRFDRKDGSLELLVEGGYWPRVSHATGDILFNAQVDNQWGAIFVLRPGGDIVQLTPRAVELISRPNPDGLPSSHVVGAAAPDGEWFAYASGRDRRDPHSPSQVFVQRFDESYPVRITSFQMAFSPTWGVDCGS